MRSRTSRHLGFTLHEAGAVGREVAAASLAVAAAESAAEVPPPEFNGHDYAIFLLRVAAEIEHSLMAQYLFAAYSLGGPNVPSGRQADVRAWQETILGIAKEEMAHLITIENLLTALGAPLNFNREDYPHGSAFYPFGFKLTPASLDSLATYVCAESPAEWDDEESREIKERAQAEVGMPVNRVGELYAQLLRLLSDQALVPDAAFNAGSVTFQASWDEWGRGYREGQRGREAMSSLPELPAPELLIVEVDSRAAAIAALAQVSEQGEGFEMPEDENESHFRRFLAIYRAMKALGAEVDNVVRPVATNPTTDPAAPDAGEPADADSPTSILHPEAKLWAHLFNVRYRKLLVNLSHAFELADDRTDRLTLSPRGALIHRTFAEMYNLRAIAGLLVRLPVDGADPAGPRAGPPFQMPYTLMLPHAEADRWRLHRDLLDAAATLVERLKAVSGAGDGQDYLVALAQGDEIERGQTELLIAGSAAQPAMNGGPVR
ncbi:MAG: ferritin-like domain-containing protein [Pseudonocardiaceae bacterium]